MFNYKNLSEKELKFAKYKWEFLRRDPKYIKEWEDLQKQLEEKHGEWRPPTGEFTKEEKSFCMKWDIAESIDPNRTWHDLNKGFDLLEPDENGKEKILNKYSDIESLDESLDEDIVPELASLTFEKLFFFKKLRGAPIVIKDGFDYENFDGKHVTRISKKLGETGKITIEVDLNYSKKRLMTELESFVDKWKENFEKISKRLLYEKLCEKKGVKDLEWDHYYTNSDTAMDEHDLQSERVCTELEKAYKKEKRNRRSKYQKKYHFDNFKIYLQVWDLKEKDGLSWKEIGNRLFPNDINAVQTARNHYNAACKIIEKGVELYVK